MSKEQKKSLATNPLSPAPTASMSERTNPVGQSRRESQARQFVMESIEEGKESVVGLASIVHEEQFYQTEVSGTWNTAGISEKSGQNLYTASSSEDSLHKNNAVPASQKTGTSNTASCSEEYFHKKKDSAVSDGNIMLLPGRIDVSAHSRRVTISSSFSTCIISIMIVPLSSMQN